MDRSDCTRSYAVKAFAMSIELVARFITARLSTCNPLCRNSLQPVYVLPALDANTASMCGRIGR
jgi:hypothetical protein